jgi:hypothetical protein
VRTSPTLDERRCLHGSILALAAKREKRPQAVDGIAILVTNTDVPDPNTASQRLPSLPTLTQELRRVPRGAALRAGRAATDPPEVVEEDLVDGWTAAQDAAAPFRAPLPRIRMREAELVVVFGDLAARVSGEAHVDAIRPQGTRPIHGGHVHSLRPQPPCELLDRGQITAREVMRDPGKVDHDVVEPTRPHEALELGQRMFVPDRRGQDRYAAPQVRLRRALRRRQSRNRQSREKDESARPHLREDSPGAPIPPEIQASDGNQVLSLAGC